MGERSSYQASIKGPSPEIETGSSLIHLMSIQLGLSVSPNWAIVGSLVSSVRLPTTDPFNEFQASYCIRIRLLGIALYIQNLGWTV